jgi:hypothetical protein
VEVLQLVDWHWPWDHRSMACLFHDIAESLRFRTFADVFDMNGAIAFSPSEKKVADFDARAQNTKIPKNRYYY